MRVTGREGALVAAAILGFLALRLAVLVPHAHLFHNWEALSRAGLAWDLAHGWKLPLPGLQGLREVVQHAQYMPFAQGTAVVAGLTALLSAGAPPSSWTVAAAALMLESVSMAVVVVLTRPLPTSTRLLAMAPWMLAPAPVVLWQVQTYGNHTTFLAIGLALGCLAGRRHAVQLPVILLGIVGIVVYRPLGLAVAAWVVADAWVQPRRALVVAGSVGIGSLLLLNVVLGPGITGGDGLLDVAGPLATLPDYAHAPLIDEPWYWPLPASMAPRCLLLAALPLGALAARRSEPARFFAIWALLALAVPLVGIGGHSPPRVLMSAFAALLGCAVLAAGDPSRWVSWPALLVLAGLTATGASDFARMWAPHGWQVTQHYDGVALLRRLGVITVDADDIPYLATMVRQGRSGEWVGLGVDMTATGCTITPILPMHGERPFTRTRPLGVGTWETPLPDPTASRCTGWAPGQLTEWIERAGQGLERPLGLEAMGQIGRGAWVACERDLNCVAAAVEGLGRKRRAALLEGARDEASLQGSPAQR